MFLVYLLTGVRKNAKQKGVKGNVVHIMENVQIRGEESEIKYGIYIRRNPITYFADSAMISA